MTRTSGCLVCVTSADASPDAMIEPSRIAKERDMTFTSPLPPVSLPAVPLTPYTLERAGRLAGKAAFIDGATGRTVTYAEFDDAVRRQASGWLERGLAKGEIVAIMAPNCAEYGVVFHAVALAGGVLT